MAALRRAFWPIWLLLCLLPVTWLVWHHQGLPLLGYYHDDGIYFLSAKDIAENGSYRVLHLPTQEHQTKYPPATSAWLSLAWLWGPYPQNLDLALWLCWLPVPLYLYLAHLLLKDYGVPAAGRAVLLALLATNPYLGVYANMAMSDGLFAVFGTLAVVLCHRERWAWAGVVAGLCVLTRTQGAFLAGIIGLTLAWRRQWPPLARFTAANLPFTLGWFIWVATHKYRGADPAVFYYTDYLRTQSGFTHAPGELLAIAQSNIDTVLNGIGRMLVCWADMSRLTRTWQWVLAAFALMGAVRVAHRARSPYQLGALALALPVLLTLPSPAGERYTFPCLPILLAGCWTEFGRIAQAGIASLRGPQWGQRLGGAVAASLVGLVLLSAFAVNTQTLLGELPQVMHRESALLSARRPAYDWIQSNLPADATFETYDEPNLTLHTGRRGIALPVLAPHTLGATKESTLGYLRTLPQFMDERGLRYVLISDGDYRRDLLDPGKRSKRQVLREESRFRPLFESPGASVWELQPNVRAHLVQQKRCPPTNASCSSSPER